MSITLICTKEVNLEMESRSLWPTLLGKRDHTFIHFTFLVVGSKDEKTF